MKNDCGKYDSYSDGGLPNGPYQEPVKGDVQAVVPELPELPETTYPAWGYDASDMRAYGRQCALAALSQGWQPIETAPRDDTPILGYGESAGEINGPSGVMEVQMMTPAIRSDYAGYDWCIAGDAYANWFKPTHWQPLPLPPAPTGAAEEKGQES